MPQDTKDQFIGFRLPKDLVVRLDEEIEDSLDFASRSHLLRQLLEDFLDSPVASS